METKNNLTDHPILSDHNQKQQEKMTNLMRKTFNEVCTKGYFGEICFKADIHDGSLQHIRKIETKNEL